VRVVEEFSTEVPRDRVISQDPPAQETVREGGTVTIVVSKGPRQFPMPTVLGLSSAQAKGQLEGLGLVVDVQDLPGSTGDQVVGQLPEAGVIVEAGQTVKIFIGGG
jgi:serine/threonine-protein kinase